MRISELNFRIGNEVISASRIIELHICDGIFEIKYMDDNMPDGVVKTSTVRCQAREVEIVCPYEICQEMRNVLGELSRDVYCTRRREV